MSKAASTVKYLAVLVQKRKEDGKSSLKEVTPPADQHPAEPWR